MSTTKLRERAVGLAGDLAGSVAEPRAGIMRLTSKATSPPVVAMGLGLVAGFLLGHWRGRRWTRAALEHDVRGGGQAG